MGNLRHLTSGTRNTDKSFHILVTGYQKRGIYDVEETTTGFGIYLRAFLEPFSAICLDYNTRAMGLCSSDHLSRVDVDMLATCLPISATCRLSAMDYVPSIDLFSFRVADEIGGR